MFQHEVTVQEFNECIYEDCYGDEREQAEETVTEQFCIDESGVQNMLYQNRQQANRAAKEYWSNLIAKCDLAGDEDEDDEGDGPYQDYFFKRVQGLSHYKLDIEDIEKEDATFSEHLMVAVTRIPVAPRPEERATHAEQCSDSRKRKGTKI